MCSNDYSSPSFYKSETRKSRMARCCSECCVAIGIGDTYESVFGVWEGDPGMVATCMNCVAARKTVTRITGCVCFSHWNLEEELQYAAREHYKGKSGERFALYRLIIGFRNKWKARPKIMVNPA